MSASGRELRSFLIRLDLPPLAIQRFRDAYPDIRFITNDDPEFASGLSNVEAMLTWGITTEEIESAPRLRWVQWIGAGVDDAPLEKLAAHSIMLTNNRGVHAINISEHVLGMMLAFARNFPFLFRSQFERQWNDVAGRQNVFELDGSSLLVVGGGQIGSMLAQKAAALGIKSQVARRQRAADGTPSDMATFAADLAQMLPLADHVALCLPLTSQTRGFFNDELFARMKPGAYFYNIGRGQVVQTEALLRALTDGHLGGAGLDVIDPEPLPAEHPLWDLPNVIITAHTAGATPKYWERGAELLITNIARFRTGQPLLNLVNYEEGY